MKKAAQLTIYSSTVIATIDPRIYGNFVEQLGRCVYGGIYEPGHPTANEQGFRGDVLELTLALNIPIVRYPGGNFVSAYNWEDGVGPRSERPRRLDYAWKTTETNQIGTNEFMDWCKLVGTKPLMAVNLGTRGMEEARRLLEYCNHPGGSALSDLRISHGYKEPHAIKTWCLGNEMDAVWQTGHKTAEEYGRLAVETARAMRQFDATLEIVACGSCSPGLPTYPEWDRVVLEHVYDQVDYLSLHLYVNDVELTTGEYLAASMLMEEQLRTIIGLCDYMKTRHRSKKTMMLCFDEWNVWDWNYMHPENFVPWSEAPSQVQQTYRMIDTVVFGSLMITLIKHAERIRIACVAQLVNVIAPIMTVTGGPAWKQGIYYPLLHGSLYGRGQVIHSHLSCPTYVTKKFDEVPFLCSVATQEPSTGTITLFVVNRHETESLPLAARFDLAPQNCRCEHIALYDVDPLAVNTASDPNRLVPRIITTAKIVDSTIQTVLPPLSWNVIRLIS